MYGKYRLCAGELGSGLDDGPREVVRIERPQVLELLPDADQLHRHAQLLRDRERDAALRGAVELGEDDAGDVHRLAEQERLAQTVLARGGVDREERLVR